MRHLTSLGNECTIRHHERGKTELTDDLLVEYLFYGYYNLVRLILAKSEMVDSGGEPHDG